MNFREALPTDIPQIQIVRLSVRENVLSDPAVVPDEDVLEFLTRRGKGWVCEVEGQIAGFSIADLEDDNVWALFVLPDFAKRGIGKKLQELMLDWYFGQGKEKMWLGTDPGTRAEEFYRRTGWTQVGIRDNGEVHFEMKRKEWEGRR
jgi:GNAT superfamily N-acetyltransferase